MSDVRVMEVGCEAVYALHRALRHKMSASVCFLNKGTAEFASDPARFLHGYSRTRVLTAIEMWFDATYSITPMGKLIANVRWTVDRKSTRLNSSHSGESRMPSSA